MGDAYSPLKALRHLDVVQAVRDRRPARPVHVQIILSDLCNQACDFCAYRDPAYSSSQLFYEIKPRGPGLRRDGDHPERNYNPARMIPHAKAIEILDDCVLMGVEGIQFTGGGEPTVHPGFDGVAAHAHARGLAFSLVTNGVNVVKRDWVEIVARAAWVRISIDAGSAETYARMRHAPAEHFAAAWAAAKAARWISFGSSLRRPRSSRVRRAQKPPAL